MKTVNLSQVNARARVEKYAEPKTKREKIMAKKKTINFVFRRCVASYKNFFLIFDQGLPQEELRFDTKTVKPNIAFSGR